MKMRKYCRIPKGSMAIYVLLNVATAVLSVSIAFIIEGTINAVSEGRMEDFMRIAATAGIFLGLYFVFQYVRNRSMQELMNQYICRLREKLFQTILSSSFETFRERAVSDYVSILTNDIQAYQEGAVRSRLCLIQNGIAALVVLGALSLTDRFLTSLVILCTFLIYWVPRLYRGRISKAQNEMAKSLSAVTENSLNHLEGFYVIRTYQIGERTRAGFGAVNEMCRQRRRGLDRWISQSEIVSMTLSVGMELMILFVSALLVFRGRLTIGEMVAVMQLSGAFVQPLMAITANLPKISAGKALEERFLQVLETGGEPGEERKEESPLSFERTLQLEDISFSYRNRKPVLENLSLTIEKGKKYAIIGENGSGKTTLINVINGIFHQSGGQILVDGRDAEGEYKRYLGLFATVGQDPFLFHTTIQDNIALADEIDSRRLEDVCRASGVEAFVKGLEKGLLEPIENSGGNLSGGQRQRIALARALYHQKPILILDEGMSAVDKKTAVEIEERLLGLEGITLLSITHDLRSPLLKRYDAILHLREGKIAV